MAAKVCMVICAVEVASVELWNNTITSDAPAGKAGIADHLNGDGDTDAVARSHISWNYNWAMNGAWNSDLDFYPQVHQASSMESLANLPNSEVLFGFNEPNMPHHAGGANMDVGQVVQFWPTIEQAANDHGVLTLVGPNVANVNPDEWYDEFFRQCPNCRVDAIGIHAYTCDLQSIQKLVDKFRKYARPLWLTEFACADNPRAIHGNDGGSKGWQWQCEYMKQVIPYLEGEDLIAKYAWFSFDTDYSGQSDLVSGGRLTDLGRCYDNLVSGSAGSPMPSTDVCAIGDHVACPTGGFCQDNQCCQDDSICPSADNSFSGCSKAKGHDCTTGLFVV